MLAFIQVTLAAHNAENSRLFRMLLERVEEVQEAYAMTGDADYLLKAIVPDLKGLSRLVNETLLAHESVARVRSSIVLERLKQSARLPLASLTPWAERRRDARAAARGRGGGGSGCRPYRPLIRCSRMRREPASTVTLQWSACATPRMFAGR
ncbi:Lrp/AsnC ligand binding domain-containing protein [Teichococcus aestuarii]|uniref:Lrp/AsnC ligand binding domain-containing protein n=1 Tax=Teichococcus aestuarii TaxID=568898 RepID=UPI003611DD06